MSTAQLCSVVIRRPTFTQDVPCSRQTDIRITSKDGRCTYDVLCLIPDKDGRWESGSLGSSVDSADSKPRELRRPYFEWHMQQTHCLVLYITIQLSNCSLSSAHLFRSWLSTPWCSNLQTVDTPQSGSTRHPGESFTGLTVSASGMRHSTSYVQVLRRAEFQSVASSGVVGEVPQGGAAASQRCSALCRVRRAAQHGTSIQPLSATTIMVKHAGNLARFFMISAAL
jgi:hypothetical protein